MKTEFDNMYDILEQIFKAVRKKEIDKIGPLNKTFESLIPPPENRTQIIYDYDNCRQSCVMATESLKVGKEDMYKMFVKDARERFDKIRQSTQQ